MPLVSSPRPKRGPAAGTLALLFGPRPPGSRGFGALALALAAERSLGQPDPRPVEATASADRNLGHRLILPAVGA
jgi:hypothetical protein